MSTLVKYSPSTDFQEAATFLSNASNLADTPNQTKLELYGLYKILTVAAEPIGSRPSVFSLTDRAKYDSWKLAGEAWRGREPDAEERYIEIARSLGWTPGAGSGDTEAGPSEAPIERSAEELLAGELHNEGGGGSGGLGLSVSIMQRDELDEEYSLHSLAINGDVQEFESFLKTSPLVNINAVDEYGFTALHLASDRGNTRIVELLLQKGADASLKDADGLSALELAVEASHEDIATLLRSASQAR